MKKSIGMLVASVLLLGVAAVWAGDGCCAGGGAAKPSVNFTANNDCFAKLNLTAEQKSKMTALIAECKTGSCNVAAREKMTAGLKAILTPEQYIQWTAACTQAKSTQSGHCPLTAKAKSDSAAAKN